MYLIMKLHNRFMYYFMIFISCITVYEDVITYPSYQLDILINWYNLLNTTRLDLVDEYNPQINK